MTGTWHQRKLFAQHALENPQKAVWLGCSYGASGATHAFTLLGKRPVRLFISLDQGLDSWIIKDHPIGPNVQEVDEYRVYYERLSYTPDYPRDRINFFDVRSLPGGHTSTFTEPAMVERIASRIIEVLSE